MAEVFTVTLYDNQKQAIMNLHNVPKHHLVQDLKKRISCRLKEIGKYLPANQMLLHLKNDECTLLENSTVLGSFSKNKTRVEIIIIRALKLNLTIKIFNTLKIACVPMKSKISNTFDIAIENHQTILYLKKKIKNRINVHMEPEKICLVFDGIVLNEGYHKHTLRQLGIRNNSVLHLMMDYFFNAKNIKEDEVEDTDLDNKETSSSIQTEAEKLFNNISKKGVATANEVGKAARKLGYSPSQHDIELLKISNKNSINFSTFQSFLANSVYAEDDPEKLASIFYEYDKDKTGFVSKKTLRWILAGWGECLSASEVNSTFKKFCDKSDEADYKKFIEKVLESRA